MTENFASRITGRVIIGALLIFFGLIFTLDNAGVLDAGDIFDYWPMILVVLEASQMTPSSPSLTPTLRSGRSGGP